MHHHFASFVQSCLYSARHGYRLWTSCDIISSDSHPWCISSTKQVAKCACLMLSTNSRSKCPAKRAKSKTHQHQIKHMHVHNVHTHTHTQRRTVHIGSSLRRPSGASSSESVSRSIRLTFSTKSHASRSARVLDRGYQDPLTR